MRFSAIPCHILVFYCLESQVTKAFHHASLPSSAHQTARYPGRILSSKSGNSGGNDDKTEAWDANVDYDKEWPQEEAPPDPSTAWDALPNMPEAPKLGIDISLEPLSKQDAEKIREEAKDIINAAIDDGIEDIENLRKKMTKELDQSRKIMQVTSELQAKKKSEELMRKIDRITGDFLDATRDTRASTKMAAAASRAMEGKELGLEMGTWGVLSGRTVVAGTSSLLGSVENAAQQQQKEVAASSRGTTPETTSAVGGNAENRIIIIADTNQDKIAKKLIPALTRRLEATDIPNLQIEVLSPTATMPLGGNNAACVLAFCTSISQGSSLKSIFDKLLRKTFQAGGALGQPPTQLVGISTVGTERSDKFPYSVANLLGKLDQRRQVEEVFINTVQRRVVEPSLDYTLIKIGEIKDGASKTPFALRPGDSLDDATTVNAAAEAIVQAVAYQPFARNSTFSISGALPDSLTSAAADDIEATFFWDTTFLPLEGPEVLRFEDVGDAKLHNLLVEYIQGWADIMAESGKGLTTPVLAMNGIRSRSSHLVEQQDGVQLLFLPTKTGKNYLSKAEERQREAKSGGKVGKSGSAPILPKKLKDGGIDVVVEVTQEKKLRVRARRCNYADDAIIKELSEETILKRLKDAMDVWNQEYL